uniref:Ubiquitin carboxyl-terminal hydrolase n=1 Tax=Timema shepardi TaxID=629360 RepID=A0A7R9G285_TIMSH|nr:unnamed protein product [Timema shepardi]
MPVPISHSRYSLSSSGTDYRTSSSLSGSLDRSWTSSRAGLSRSTSYVSKYTPTSRTSSVPYFSRTSSSLSEDSGISSRYSASSVNSTSSAVRERSKSREPSIGSYNSSIGSSRSRDSSKSRIVDGGSSTSYNSSLGRHHGSLSSSISSELYKYSQSYYLSNSPLTLRDVGKPPSRPVTTFQSDTDNTFKKGGYSYPRSRRSPLIDSSSESSLPSPSTRSNRSISSAGIGGGYSATSPIERRSRFNNSSSSLSTSSNEVILHLNNTKNGNVYKTTSSNVKADENSEDDDSDDDGEEGHVVCDECTDNENNGNHKKLIMANTHSKICVSSEPDSISSTPKPESSFHTLGYKLSKNINSNNSKSENVGGKTRRKKKLVSNSDLTSSASRVHSSPIDLNETCLSKNLKDDDNDSENNESHQKIETNVDTGEESSDEDDSEGNYSSNEADDILKHSPSPKTNLPSLSTNTDIISSPGRVAGGATATTVRAGSPPSNRLSRSRYHLDTQETSATSGDLESTKWRSRLRLSEDGAGLVGLRNIGNTCFMNSVIQCLSNTKPLLEYLLSEKHLSDINTSVSSMKGALIKAFSQVIQELWKVEHDGVVNTTALKSQIQRFAPRFMGYNQQDAQEFLRYLLEGLHEDVNRIPCKPKPILTDVDEMLSDHQKAVESWKRYLRMDDSKIVDLFVGQLKSTLRCSSCGHCSITFDPFWDLSLPIPSRTGQLRLQQCLDHFTKEEVLDGDEKPVNMFKVPSTAKMYKKLYHSEIPKNPRLTYPLKYEYIKRFSPLERFRGKLSVIVDFPLSGLDLNAYASNKGSSCCYNLYGVANHSGTTYSGHYTASCKHPYTGDWHEYNDSRLVET